MACYASPPFFVGRNFAVKRKYITFASVKEQTRISVLASVLLAVFLPMVIISSIHVHHVDSVDNDLCVKCVRHVPHATHFSAHIVKFEHCLFCHFMSLVFMAAAIAGIALYKIFVPLITASVRENAPQPVLAGTSPRGPPCSRYF